MKNLQSAAPVPAINQVTTIQMVNPQTVQAIGMVNGQLTHVLTPTNQITTQPTVVATVNQPQMMIVQNPRNQQSVQVAAQSMVQPAVQAAVHSVMEASAPSASVDNIEHNLPPSYQVAAFS